MISDNSVFLVGKLFLKIGLTAPILEVKITGCWLGRLYLKQRAKLLQQLPQKRDDFKIYEIIVIKRATVVKNTVLLI